MGSPRRRKLLHGPVVDGEVAEGRLAIFPIGIVSVRRQPPTHPANGRYLLIIAPNRIKRFSQTAIDQQFAFAHILS
jgi:hypothetical protein